MNRGKSILNKKKKKRERKKRAYTLFALYMNQENRIEWIEKW